MPRVLFAQLEQVLPVVGAAVASNSTPPVYSAACEGEMATKLYRLSHTQWQRLLDRLASHQLSARASGGGSGSGKGRDGGAGVALTLPQRVVLGEIDAALSADQYVALHVLMSRYHFVFFSLFGSTLD